MINNNGTVIIQIVPLFTNSPYLMRFTAIANILFMASILAGCLNNRVIIPLSEGEKVWGGRIADGYEMPYNNGFASSLYNNSGNQVNPLLLTNKGRYVWSEQPFDFKIEDNRIIINNNSADIQTGINGYTLKSAFQKASSLFFPANGAIPPQEFFKMPQYNTWIELMYNQNQDGIIEYAENILANGLPPGIIMIDDTWQDDYGKWVFDSERFYNPKSMIDRLHQLGFKVMLWICPFVSMDQYLICSNINAFNGFLRSKDGNPYPVRWWNGTSAVLDLSNPKSVEWFKGELDRLMKDYGIDGFKFDAGDFDFYPEDAVSFSGKTSGAEQCSLFVQLAEKYEYNELRAGWKNAGKAIVQRLHDKDHSWEDLNKLIPEMLAENLMGYSFSCPDMVGGGSFMTFLEGNIDQDLLVRSAQCHALMPMMQFSLAPWRVLDKEHYEAIIEAVGIRNKMQSYIDDLIVRSAKSGEPIISPLEYMFPERGYSEIKDQFMLGDSIMVTPMLTAGSKRTIIVPEGEWLSDTGETITGDIIIEINVPLERLPYFIKQK